MAVRTELLESAIPEELIKQLPYRDVTAEEAKRLTGFNLEGWVVGMNSPSGEAYKTSEGKPFYRLKPTTPVIGKNGKPSNVSARPSFGRSKKRNGQAFAKQNLNG